MKTVALFFVAAALAVSCQAYGKDEPIGGDLTSHSHHTNKSGQGVHLPSGVALWMQ